MHRCKQAEAKFVTQERGYVDVKMWRCSSFGALSRKQSVRMGRGLVSKNLRAHAQ